MKRRSSASSCSNSAARTLPDAVEPFLYNLFCDPDIINFPWRWLARRPLARYIARKRAGVVREHYDAIGGQSPIRLLTERQAARWKRRWRRISTRSCCVAMRYWNPLTAETAAAVARRRSTWSCCRSIRTIPLPPRCSSLKEWKRLYRPRDGAPQRDADRGFHTHPLYIAGHGRKDCHQPHALSTSPTGAPGFQRARFAAQPDRARRSVPAARGRDRARGSGSAAAGPIAHTLCYQSRVGRQKWLEPSLTQTHRRAGAGRRRNICWSIPISFVTEHIETLHEINIEAREEAHGRRRRAI